MQQEFLEKNQKIKSQTGFTLDGLLGSTAAAFLAPEGSKLMTGALTALSHQFVHNSIDNCAPDNVIKAVDRSIPTIPLDGIVGTFVAYLTGGFYSALGFGAIHGPAHMTIEPNQK